MKGMKMGRMALPLVILVGWGVGAGCDDDRGVVDLGPGGSGTQQAEGGAAGEAAGGPSAVAGGGSGGDGVSQAGAGGQPSGECPSDVLGADGTSCAGSQEGDQCSDEDTDDPCGFGQSIVCEAGTWHLQEAFPQPCGGAGGAGGVSSAGNGGAGGASAGAGGAP